MDRLGPETDLDRRDRQGGAGWLYLAWGRARLHRPGTLSIGHPRITNGRRDLERGGIPQRDLSTIDRLAGGVAAAVSQGNYRSGDVEKVLRLSESASGKEQEQRE